MCPCLTLVFPWIVHATCSPSSLTVGASSLSSSHFPSSSLGISLTQSLKSFHQFPLLTLFLPSSAVRPSLPIVSVSRVMSVSAASLSVERTSLCVAPHSLNTELQGQVLLIRVCTCVCARACVCVTMHLSSTLRDSACSSEMTCEVKANSMAS